MDKTFLGTIKTARDAVQIFDMANGWYNRFVEYRRENRYQVVIKKSDDVYNDVLKWIAEVVPPGEMKRGNFVTRKEYNWEFRKATLLYDEAKPHNVIVDGYKVEICIDTPENRSAKVPTDEYGPVSPTGISTSSIIFSTPTIQGRDAIVQLITDIALKMSTELNLCILNGWNEWNTRPLQDRPLESVVLKQDVKEKLINDLETFTDSEGLYVQWGIPWHRGYLLYGVPGTGKSSLIKALANKLNLNVYFLNISSLKGDKDLQTAVSEIRKRSILVLEDVDGLAATRSREEYDPETGGVTLSGLLNVLDGLMTPHGLITFMTTNHRDKLDPALIRAGRADVQIELDYLDDEQLEKMCMRFFGRYVEIASVEGLNIAPAEVVTIFKTNIANIDQAEYEIKELVNSRLS